MASKQKAATEPDVFDVLRAGPRSTLEEVAEALGVARSTAHKRLAAAVAEGKVQRHAGGREGRRRLPDRYAAIEAPAAAEPAGHKADPTAGDQEGGSTRLRQGELDGLVLAHIAANSNEAPFSPTAIAKALARSGGAVANCLERLSDRGELARVGERPRRYRTKAG
ncbi:MAG: helix-turn-helix domain-containing protein [Actinobacteria bacterium]|nr:helix-turn-helix domain-containing protein [Actinomycetota bacterium]